MARTPQPCGTAAAWARHRYYGETPCDPCVEAYRAAARKRNRAARARRAALVRLPGCECDVCCCDRGGSHCRQRGCSACIPPATITTTPKETAVTSEDHCTGTHECGCDDCEQHWADLASADGETPDGQPLHA